MCHQIVPHPPIILSRRRQHEVIGRRWVVSDDETHAGQTQRESGGAGGTKLCVCSPTRHPGSFRCRYHRAQYLWRAAGNRITTTAAAASATACN
ncbi:hypothetical protein LINGRAHAP2_LOCUS21508 [Linum grandiflorum]